MVRTVKIESPYDDVSTTLGRSTRSKKELRKLERRLQATANYVRDANANVRIGINSPSGLWIFGEPTPEKIREAEVSVIRQYRNQ